MKWKNRFQAIHRYRQRPRNVPYTRPMFQQVTLLCRCQKVRKVYLFFSSAISSSMLKNCFFEKREPNSFSKFKAIGLRCKNLCSLFPFQFIVLEAFIHFIRYVVVQRLMKPRRVVEVEVGINSCLQIFHCFIAF